MESTVTLLWKMQFVATLPTFPIQRKLQKVNMIWRAESSYLSLSHMHETDSATFSKTSLSEHPQDPSADVPINNMVPSAKNNQKLSGILVTSQPPKHQNRPV